MENPNSQRPSNRFNGGSRKARGGYRGWSWRGGRGGWAGRKKPYTNTGNARSVNNVISSQTSSLLDQTVTDCPYVGWNHYFPQLGFSKNSSEAIRLNVFKTFFQKILKTYKIEDIQSALSFVVDYNKLVTDVDITQANFNFEREMCQDPNLILNCMSLAMHQIIVSELSSKTNQDFLNNILPKIHCRILNFKPIICLKLIKANFYGKLISVQGTVVRVGSMKPLCVQMVFKCQSCATLQIVNFTDGKFAFPSKCSLSGCRAKTFAPQRNHDKTLIIDWQRIRVQEIENEDDPEAGRIPRTIDVELTNDLVDCCVPGDRVTVVGIVKVLNTESGKNSYKNKDKCMFNLYIDANSVHNTKRSVSSSISEPSAPESSQSLEFNMKDLYAIEHIHSEPNLMRLIVASICPAIYGHEMVKAGLVLGLFGGCHHFQSDKNAVPIRGDPHILVVGDPGLGKSQMLQAVSNTAPRSVYVCGNSTTVSGLTITLTRDGSGSSGNYMLEGGALVLADQGCCCIDEFDKMSGQHQALLEAMEQQSISIAKAGIVCSLPARTSILAAANPIGGHYNKAKTVSENLRMNSALLSRFDLVFILLDKPDEELDGMLSEHVMARHSKKSKNHTESANTSMNTSVSTLDQTHASQWFEEKVFTEKLKVPRGERLDLIPTQLLRKYISYAKKYVQPTLSEEAAKVLQNFYLKLRQNHQTSDTTPITTRQLESLIRLTEARARVELREVCSKQDAEDIVDLMTHSMAHTLMDEFGGIDFERSQNGSGMSSRSHAKKFIAILQGVSNKTFNNIFTVQEMRKIMQDYQLKISDFEGFVNSLNNQGFLLKKGPRVYQLQSSDF